MERLERGVVVEARRRSALVRLAASPACSGCVAAGGCRAAGAEGERLLDALDPFATPAGAQVEIAVDARPAWRAAARRWLLPAAGMLGGAGLAQLAAGVLLPAEAVGKAAGLGGIAGGVAGILLERAARARGGPPPAARIVRRLEPAPPR